MLKTLQQIEERYFCNLWTLRVQIGASKILILKRKQCRLVTLNAAKRYFFYKMCTKFWGCFQRSTPNISSTEHIYSSLAIIILIVAAALSKTLFKGTVRRDLKGVKSGINR
jgi:hypothetical protein